MRRRHKAADILNVATNVLLLSLAAFVVLRPAGPVESWIKGWMLQRRIRENVSRAWPRATGEGGRVGSPNARRIVIEFSDYQCPFCARAHGPLRDLLANDDDLAVIVRHLPLPIHPYAEKAALSSICAERLGRFEPMHNILFGLDWSQEPDWSELAGTAGVRDLAAFESCLTGPIAGERLARDVALAGSLQVRSTPTFVGPRGIKPGAVDASDIDDLLGSK